MVETEIIVAIIGASVTLASPFIALFISKCCEKNKPDKDPDPKPKPKPEPKPKSICEILSTDLLPPFYTADQRYCHLPKKICPGCGMTFCENHITNNNKTSYGGHICNMSLHQP